MGHYKMNEYIGVRCVMGNRMASQAGGWDGAYFGAITMVI